MCEFRAFLRQCFIMELLGFIRIKAEIELISPTKLKPGLGERIVTDLGAGVAFGKVGGVCCNFIRDNPVLHVILVGETKVFGVT